MGCTPMTSCFFLELQLPKCSQSSLQKILKLFKMFYSVIIYDFFLYKPVLDVLGFQYMSPSSCPQCETPFDTLTYRALARCLIGIDKSFQFWLLSKRVEGLIHKIRSRIPQDQETLHTPGKRQLVDNDKPSGRATAKPRFF